MEYPKGLGTIWPDDAEQSPVTAYFTPPQKKNYPEGWLILWQDESEIGVSMKELAKSNITLAECKVLMFLMGSIGLGNYVFVNQTEVARELNIHRVTVVESIKRLCQLEILIKGPKSGRSNTYMVNPALCFKGNIGHGQKQRSEAIKQSKAKIIPFSQKKRFEQDILGFAFALISCVTIVLPILFA
jgi:hypothetical protein